MNQFSGVHSSKLLILSPKFMFWGFSLEAFMDSSANEAKFKEELEHAQ